MADRHLGKAHLARQRSHLAFVLRVAVGVHEHDRHRLDAVAHGRFEIAPHGGEIGRALDGAVGTHALVHLGDALVEQFRLDDLARKNLRARLVADLERVAKAARDQQQRSLALALEQRVGRNRGAHLDGADAAGRDRLAGLQSEQVADALHRGVGIGFGIFRQQLVRLQRAVRPPPDHVGERAAAVDPEIPELG